MVRSFITAASALALILTAGVATPAFATPAPSAEIHVSPDIPVPITYDYKAASIQTTNNYTNKSVILAKCSNPGGTCSIKSESSHGTSIGTAFTATAAELAPSLNFTMSDTNSTGVTCNSGRALKSGELYEAFALGVYKSYVVQKYAHGTNTLDDTSGRTHGFDPYTYPAITCLIE